MPECSHPKDQRVLIATPKHCVIHGCLLCGETITVPRAPTKAEKNAHQRNGG
jgi:hypothetical protein